MSDLKEGFAFFQCSSTLLALCANAQNSVGIQFNLRTICECQSFTPTDGGDVSLLDRTRQIGSRRGADHSCDGDGRDPAYPDAR